jgi:4-hydroxythreonine-4-phosphate dehydrogenase
MPTDNRPRLAITLGDPAGIGPEVAMKALADEGLRARAKIAVFGPSLDVWRRLAGDAAQKPIPFRTHKTDGWDGGFGEGTQVCLGVVDTQVFAVQHVQTGPDLANLEIGKPSALSGEASIQYMLAAIDAARRGEVDGIVTAPISKEAIHSAGYPWHGHTELLAEKFGAADVAMMFAGGPFRVILVTIHVSLLDAIHSLSAERIVRACRMGSDALRRWFGVEVPRLGVCGLNPHASEAGRFGHEERETIGPAIEEARAAGLCVFGPLPPDTAFYQAMKGRFDLIVALYHDQGLIPLKTVSLDDSVNITVGLPIVRTSPDHGTAYDIAGRGQASPSSMKAALKMAIEMVERGRPPLAEGRGES